MDKDRFTSDRNIERYRRLACAAVTGPERTDLLGLLAQEEDKYFDRGGTLVLDIHSGDGKSAWLAA
jgi:hypothetical protein